MKKKYILKSSISNSQGFDMSALNSDQQAAVMHDKGPLMVLAGAGSGKTKTLVFRVARLIHDGIDPKQILLLTFTRKASNEMLKRAADILDTRCQNVAGGTFHSFSNYLLHQYAAYIQYPTGFTIMDRSDSEQLMGFIRKDGAYQTSDKRFPKKNTLLDIHSKSMNLNLTIEQVVRMFFPHFDRYVDQMTDISTQYHIRKKALSVMDYDDLLIKLVQLLSQHSDVRDAICSRYRYILVDEFQDTNHVQLNLVKQLCTHHQNIMVVGDDAQSIYSFRGADVTNMINFEDHFNDVTVIQLNTNYRSVQAILDISNAVINESTCMFSKALQAVRNDRRLPIYIELFDAYEQAEFIVQRILEFRELGIDLQDMAVLFRSSAHSNELEVELQRSNLPFKKFGGFKFTETAHIKDVLAYVRIMVNRHDQLSWLRVLQQYDGVGPVMAKKIMDTVLRASRSLLAINGQPFVKNVSLQDDLYELFHLIETGSDGTPAEVLARVVDYYRPMLRSQYDDHPKREQDLDALIAIGERFSSLSQLIDDFTLEPPEVSQVGGESISQDDECLTLSTIHSAKGLEWTVVFILSLVDGYLPSVRSLMDPQQIEEERRLLYVAITRAKSEVYLLKPTVEAPRHYSSIGGGMGVSKRCRFLTNNMIDQYCDQWVIGANHHDDDDDTRTYSL